MSLANKITFGRAALIPGVIVLLLLSYREAAIALFLLASLGDILDGMAARWRKEVSPLGKALDPAVDKALYVSVFSVLTVQGQVPLLALILFVAPQLGLAIGALFLQVSRRWVQGARLLGKGAAVLTFVAAGFLILQLPEAVTLLYAAIGASYLASLDYLIGALRAKRSLRSDGPGTAEGPATRSGPDDRSRGG
jgi:phosphatidylglycerophosphate synthase